MWTTLIICVTLVLLALLGLSAWLPYLKWGSEILKNCGIDELAALTEFIRAWPNPLSWIGNAARSFFTRKSGSTDDEGDSNDRTSDESFDEEAA